MLSRRRVFLDTSFFIAINNTRDEHHARALAIDAELADARVSLILHAGIVLEIGDGYSRANRREKGLEILQGMAGDQSYSVFSIDDNLLRRGIELWAQRSDKDWGLTDCISFVLMRDLRITDVLTADVHFVQAGFRALLLE